MMRQTTTTSFPTILALTGVLTSQALAQAPPPPLTSVEPGLERAVQWKWNVEPGPERDWGLELPVFTPPPAPASGSPVIPQPGIARPSGRPEAYVVQRGDALAKISRRFGITVQQLKKANGLTNDMIRVGEELRIPTPEEIAAMTPATPTPRPVTARPDAPEAGSPEAQALDTLALQIFLDRSLFSAGPLDGENTPEFQQLVRLYIESRDDVPNAEALVAKARAAVPNPITSYTLRREDFHFIAPPKAPTAAAEPKPASPPKKRPGTPPTPAPTPEPTYEDLTTSRMLAYRSPWEFVAERFHCSEAYLRKLNPQITGIPSPGTEFRVPATIPFEIERAFAGPIQPAGGEGVNPMTAAIVNRTRLEIRRNDQLIATMPVSIARPGLRGRDAWVVLRAVPRPRLTSLKEARNPSTTPSRIYGREDPNAPTPTPTPVPKTQILAPGPNNPVGLVWIDLALQGEDSPLPYGLHGTSMPEQMATHESLGGIRMANWDILRAVRMLPPGTPLAWTQTPPPRAAPPAM